MARPRAHLRNAPIVEALIDFRVLRRPDLQPDAFSDLRELIGPAYQAPTPIHTLEATFGLKHGEAVQAIQTQTTMGWLYRGQNAVAQFRIDGFTFNKLEPYTTWEAVFGEANRLWAVYVQIARQVDLSRVAVRYINRLRLPGPAELQQYLEAPPQLPVPIPQKLKEFLSRVVVDDSRRRASAIIVQALEASLDPTVIPVLLDIDAFREVAMPAQGDEIAEQLRALKNDVFYASVTEQTVEMYE